MVAVLGMMVHLQGVDPSLGQMQLTFGVKIWKADWVLSDECELVSARTMKPPVMPHRVDATQQERRFG